MVVFAFATMIAWYYLGCQTLEAVTAQMSRWVNMTDSTVQKIKAGYLILYGYSVFLGCVSTMTAVWELSDIWNGLMAFPNMAAILMLHSHVRYP
jgi:AGCS family alanine or glycine:cation symporter